MSQELRIGLVTPWACPWVHGVLEGISEAVQSHRSWAVRTADPVDADVSRVLRWGCHGVMANVATGALADELAALNVPVVNFSGWLREPRFPTVKIDDRRVGALAAEHLLDLHLRHFAYWPGCSGALAALRGEGFFETLRHRGVPTGRLHTLAAPSGLAWKQRDRRLRAWLLSLPKPVGILVSVDVQGYYLADIAREAGLDIPNEIALLGVGNNATTCHLSVPSLSSIQLPTRRVGAAVVGMLDDLLSGRSAPAEPVLLPPVGVIPRGSTDMLAIDDVHVVDAVRYIREHAGEGLSVNQVLDRVPLSRRTLEHRFETLFGRTPGEEIRRVRIERAKFVLLDSDAPMSEVARRAGFSDAAYLARVFRRETGLSPSRYRGRYRRM
ncbi:MAG: substrate-binding domain-containing protein [Planctomycetota bacterium]